MSCSRYNGKLEDSLTKLWFVLWNLATAANDHLSTEELHPTEGVRYFHSLCVYLEVSMQRIWVSSVLVYKAGDGTVLIKFWYQFSLVLQQH